MKATYIDHMGSDLSVVNAARVSFGKKHTEFDVERDTKLINYLARHGHKSPFNHTFLTFHVKAPIFVARQLVKHKFMPWNEVSRRYVDDPPEFYVPDEWRSRAKDKKQGSGSDTIKDNGWYPDDFSRNPLDSRNDWSGEWFPWGDATMQKGQYEMMIYKGVAPEQARMVLPQNTYTEWYWSGTLGAFADMYNLRAKEDTQYETRLIAEEIGEQIEPLFPVSWEALTNG